MPDSNQTTSTTMNDLKIIMAMVEEERIVFRFTVAEKTQRTYQVTGSTTWKEAEAHMEEGFYGDNVTELDGSFEGVEDYKPNRDQRIKQVKIGYTWYDVNDLMCDPQYYLRYFGRKYAEANGVA